MPGLCEGGNEPPGSLKASKTHFDIGCHARIPTRNTILRWEASFHITGSTLKKKSPGRNSIALRLSEATVRSRALRLLSLGPFEGVGLGSVVGIALAFCARVAGSIRTRFPDDDAGLFDKRKSIG
ncbi:hypothetical protein ANN_25224 [Periplaneta americana]|uniref:Uncharacterized protein n=1 Tax=Periplaneta americana TaxID=6978 RepID=A0ABQ8S0X1_PERAM|nr:hypothetical protein ANN_25224 [Periplaneta americana]